MDLNFPFRTKTLRSPIVWPGCAKWCHTGVQRSSSLCSLMVCLCKFILVCNVCPVSQH
ncbi:unnamed protein product, partial [Staurois parvus]